MGAPSGSSPDQNGVSGDTDFTFCFLGLLRASVFICSVIATAAAPGADSKAVDAKPTFQTFIIDQDQQLSRKLPGFQYQIRTAEAPALGTNYQVSNLCSERQLCDDSDY